MKVSCTHRKRHVANFLVLLVAGVTLLGPSKIWAQSENHLLLGNPSNAKADGSDKDNFLMEKKFFTLSFNNTKGTPNWVSWELSKDDLGKAKRKPTFDTDTTLPSGFTRVETGDYTSSGFDRGHMCPHSDRAHDLDMSFSTFIMTNIIPQAPNVNEKAWAQLEAYCRDLVADGDNRLYIVSGPAGQGGRGKFGLKTEIGRNATVVVPATCWKIAVVVPTDGGDDDLKKIDKDTRVIAVIMPNDNSVGEEWAEFRTSVSAIEKLTGFNFFSAIHDPAVVKALKKQIDEEPIAPPQTLHHAVD
jgi:endonuclease G